MTKQEYAFWNSPLDTEEQWYEDHSDEFVPCERKEEMRSDAVMASSMMPIVHKKGNERHHTAVVKSNLSEEKQRLVLCN